MGLLNIFRKQLATVIEWRNPAPEILLEEYTDAGDEIKSASKLIVSPGQGCVSVYEGRIVDILTDEGIYTLKSDNHPFITTLMKLRRQFESEHKLRLFFFRTTNIPGQGWGLSTPVKYLDPVYQFPVRLSGYGNYSYRISDIRYFLQQIIGVRNRCVLQDVRGMVSGRIIQTITSVFAGGDFSFMKTDENLPRISASCNELLGNEFTKLGLILSDFQIMAVQFDEESLARLNRMADIAVDAQAARDAGMDYAELEKLRALRDAARAGGELTGAGVQFGAGIGLARMMTDKNSNNTDNSQV